MICKMRILDVEIFQVVEVVVALAVTYIVAKIVSKTLEKLFEEASFAEDVKKGVIKASKYVVYILGLLAIISVIGVNITGLLVGVGFFGIVVGLTAQIALGNIFSGLMLVIFRPFKIGDRIALVTWQYGKFPPTFSHGWLEPSYTGFVKEITLMYTKILTDSNVLLTIPNGAVSQSLIMNLHHDKHGYFGTQFEVPIDVNPDELHKSLNSQLSGMPDFKGEEESFEILEISPSAYIVAITYRFEAQHEQEMKFLLFRAIRMTLTSTYKSDVK